MSFSAPSPAAPTSPLLPYAQASVAQRAQLLAYVRQRLHPHFPTLSPAAWLRALFEFQPTLVLTSPDTVTLTALELTQLVQHVASAPELSLLDPPLFGLPALELAQRWQHGQELTAAVLPELTPGTCFPRLLTLLTYLSQPCPLAERVVQAWRWDLASAPPLLPGLPGGGRPLSPEQVQGHLTRLQYPLGY